MHANYYELFKFGTILKYMDSNIFSNPLKKYKKK